MPGAVMQKDGSLEYLEKKQVRPITRKCIWGEMDDGTSGYNSDRFIIAPNALFEG